MRSKSKLKTMKSYKNNKTEASQKLKNQKRKTPQDIISKSLFKCLTYRATSNINFKFFNHE